MFSRAAFLIIAAMVFSLVYSAGFSRNSSDLPTSQTVVTLFPAPGSTRVVDLPEVRKMLNEHGSSLLVVNFWATWCSPCVEELPFFIKASKEYSRHDVRFLGISADLKSDVDSRVVPFLRKHEIPYSNVVFFGKSDDMINFFSTEWKGDLPATFFFDQHGKILAKILRPMTYEELRSTISDLRPK